MGFAEKRGKTWRWRYRVGGVLASESGFPTKSAAERWGAALEVDQARGLFVDPRGGEMTLGEWIEVWTQSRSGLKDRTVTTDASRARLHITPTLGSVRLRELDQLVVGRWVKGLQATLAPKTVRNCHGLLYSILQGAVDARLIRGNPCDATRLPELGHSEMVFLTQQQFGRLHAAAPVQYQPLLTTLVGTGLRWGEAAGLRARYVDVLGGTLRIVESLHEDDKGGLSWGTPKSRQSRRVVSLNSHVRDALVPLVANAEPDDVVFTAAAGTPLRRANFSRVWSKAITDAKLEVRPRVHDLRHTHVAWLIAAGVPVPAISRRLGHASISITIDRYGHLLPEVDEALLDALDGAFSMSEIREPESAAPVSLPPEPREASEAV